MRSVLKAVCAIALFATSAAQARTLNVVASFTVLADVIKEVGGDHVTVKSLVPPDGDPHEFEPAPDDAKALKAADLAIVSGEGLETWFERLAKASGYKGKVVVASSGVPTLQAVEDGKRTTDPHVWNNPLNVARWAANIAEALAAADPDDRADFLSRAERYSAQLKEADAYAHSKIDPIPASKRKILTSHDAFGYFGKAYGVEFLAPVGYSTETEPSAAAVAKIIQQIKKEGVKVYFFENSSDKRLVKQIADATGAAAGGELYVESLSKPDGPAGTYVKMFRYNVDQMSEAMTR